MTTLQSVIMEGSANEQAVEKLSDVDWWHM